MIIDAPRSFANGELLLGGLLLGQSDLSLIGSGNVIGLLGHMELDVAVGGEVWRDTTMSSISSSSAVDGSLSGNMGDGALFWVEGLSHGV